MKLFLQILIALFFISTLHSQEAVKFNCVEVEDDGGTILRWIPQGSDILYHAIYYSANGTAFDSIGNLPGFSFLYSHSESMAHLGSRYYYIKTVNNKGFANSDTLRTIYLQVDNNPDDYNKADLYWNSINDPYPEGYSAWYKILRENPIGNWTLHDSVPVNDTTYSEPVIVCYDSITYRIYIENNLTGCSSISNSRGAIFRDNEYPQEPFFDSVSINQDEHPVLGWTPSSSEDVNGYIVYRFENNNWIEIDRIDGRNTTFYVDSIPNPCNESISYAIAAIDSCANKSEGTFLKPRKTILLNDVVNDVCTKTNTITWSEYENAQPDLEGYKIYYNIDGGPFSLLGTIHPDSLTATHGDIQPGLSYTYYVQAVFESNSSTSCKKTMTGNSYQQPSFSYFANANVMPSNDITLTFDLDPTYKYLLVIRDEDQAGPGMIIDSINASDWDFYPVMITDTSANPELNPYHYFVEVYDSCGLKALTSNENITIHLEVADYNQNETILTWNAYEGWDAGVEKYYIYRMINNTEPVMPIDSVNSFTIEYTDDISSIGSGTGQLIYWVQAVENEGNVFGFQSRANSNRTTVSAASEMYMPNAFRPGGYTPDFKPVYRFSTGDNYLFQIYNRWGQLIFESEAPEKGWDGKYKNQTVPQGVYMYKLVYNKSDGNSIVKRGTVTVIY